MVVRAGPPATRSREPGQARKGAAAAVDVCAGVWLAWSASPLTSLPSFVPGRRGPGGACLTLWSPTPRRFTFTPSQQTRMSYQVLARKWRPRSFADMVGQGHVVRALSNALERGQLHHAYLFTGTRGVGKTTLARILSKCLNCELGVSATPCGVCSACRAVDEGRFVDLLEVDAASRTKVDQTRDLMDNVPFAPISGRYKVYLIDEVHMFSAGSFNALLKTLEEPPPHVKFLLATTDPQKVPVTVLSRCLQFTLKRLTPAEIAAQLAHILGVEGVPFDAQALALLARAADGSMRDGLSLLDQAIAFGGGRVDAAEVGAMLGTVGRGLTLDLAEALASGDGARLLAEVARVHELTPELGEVLSELLVLLHRIALYQQVPATLGADDPDQGRIVELAQGLSPEDVQLFYQVILLGQQDLPLAPDPRTGLEMVLLRALAFRPEGAPPALQARSGAESDPHQRPQVRRPAAVRPELGSPPDRAVPAGPPVAAKPAESGAWPAVAEPMSPAPAAVHSQTRPEVRRPDQVAPAASGRLQGPEDWHPLVARLGLRAIAAELANNCEFASWDGTRLCLNLDPAGQQMHVPAAEERLRGALAEVLGVPVILEIRVRRTDQDTPAQRRARQEAERLLGAQTQMQADPVVQGLKERFDAEWVPDSIKPWD
jgi:DNA polymerase III subunit gamma/tau